MNLDIINEEYLKTDIGVVIVFCTLLVLMKLNIKEKNRKIIIFLQKNYLKVIILIMFCISTANLMYNARYNMQIIREEASPVNQEIYASVVNIYEKIINNIKNYDKGIYRIISKFQNGANDAITYGYNGVSYSSSAYSKKLYYFLEKLGIRTSHVQVLCDVDNTKVVDMLLGIKYFIIEPNKEFIKDYPIEYEELYIENNAKIHRNPYSLSLGYVVDKNIFNTNMNNSNTFELQNEILRNMTHIEENVYSKQKGKINKTTEGIKQDGTLYKKTGENAKIIYEFEAESDNNIYIYLLSTSDEEVEVFVDGKDTPEKLNSLNNKMINVGKKIAGEKVKIEIVPYGDLNISNIHVYYENEAILNKHYEKLSSKEADISKIDNRTYKANINIENEEEYMMLTIPYENGWNVKVDGEKAEYIEVLDTLIAIKLHKGQHEIVLEYMPSGMISGAILSITGILMLIAIIVVTRKEKI